MMEKHLSEPWFSLVACGAKTYEGRLGNNSTFKNMEEGTLVRWYNDDLGGVRRTVDTKVTAVTRHKTFETMMRSKGLQRVLPTVVDMKHGVEVYKKFYPIESQKKHGVLCLALDRV